MTENPNHLGHLARVTLTSDTRREVRMAQKVMIELVDDLDGMPADETVAFGLDGRTYEIDLSKKNAEKLRKALKPFVDGARRVSGSKTKAKVNGSGDAKAIREWAKSVGLEVSNRGQIPREIREAYSNR